MIVDKLFEQISERTTQVLSFTLVDEAQTPIPGTALVSMTLTLFNRANEQIINSRDGVDVKSFVSPSGVFTMTLDPEDSPIVDDTAEVETHIALFRWTYNAGKVGGIVYGIPVRNIARLSS